MALREIIAHFAFDFDAHKADEADKKIEHVKHGAEGAASGVGVLVEAMQALAAVEIFRVAKEWVEGLVETATELEHTAAATGLSTAELQEWQLGAAEADIRGEEFSLALRRLSSAMAGGKDEAGSQAAIFAKLGIKTKDATGQVRSLSDVLPEIADHFQGMRDGAAKAALAQELFGRQGARLIPLLNKGAEGVQELHRDFEDLGGGFSEELIERAAAFEREQARLNVATNSFKSIVGVYLLPYLTDLIKMISSGVSAFREWAKETTLVEQGVKTLAKAIGVALWAALSPFLFGALKFAAIFLAFDDLNAFLDGQRSLIGRALDAIFGDGTATVVREWIQDAQDWFKSGFAAMGLVAATFEADVIAGFAYIESEVVRIAAALVTAWNATIKDLHLPEFLGGNKEATAGVVGASVKESADAAQKLAVARSLHQRVDAFNQANTPTTDQVSAGPLAHNVTYANSVELNPTINIQVAAGENADRTARNIKVATQDAMRQQRRAALQALENRAPGSGG